MAKSEGHVFRVNEVVPVCAAPTPSLPPTPAGLGVFLFKSQAAYFKHWLKSIIYRQIFRRVQSSLGAEGVSVCSSPRCCALGSDSKGRVKNLKVVKVLYPVFTLVSFQVRLMLLLPRLSSPPGRVQEVAVEEHPSLHTHGELTDHQGHDLCWTAQHSKQLQFRVF